MQLQDVDRRVHHDPHYVDEVPVDPGDFDTVVVLGREVAAEGANRRHREQAETDEDVGSVEPRQPVEDRPERAVVRREPDAGVLADLRQQDDEPETDREHEPGLEPRVVPALDRLQRPVDREARGDEHARVDAGDEHRQVELRRGPVDPVDDAHEEVRGEERAEEHDLRRDEEEHPERRRVHAGALVRDGRLALILGVRAHASAPALSISTSTYSTGTPASFRRRPIRSRRSQLDPAPAGNVETRISSTRSSRTACMTALYGSGCATCPCTSRPSPRRIVSARRSLRSASGCAETVGSLCGQMIRNDAGERFARSRMRSRRGSPTTVSFATTRTFAGPPSACMSTTTWSTGSGSAALRIRSTTLRCNQPDRSSGCVETTTASIGGSAWAIASRVALTGSVSTTNPLAGIPASRSSVSVRSRRRPADARRVSSYTT